MFGDHNNSNEAQASEWPVFCLTGTELNDELRKDSVRSRSSSISTDEVAMNDTCPGILSGRFVVRCTRPSKQMRYTRTKSIFSLIVNKQGVETPAVA